MNNLTDFDTISLGALSEKIEATLTANRTKLETLLAKGDYSWEGLLHPLERMEAELDELWGSLSHLNSVTSTPEVRSVYDANLPKIIRYGTEFSQHSGLYAALEQIDPARLSPPAAQALQNTLRNFRLSGVGLPEEEKKIFGAYSERLGNLSNQFAQNVLDCADAWRCHIDDAIRLSGLPASTKNAAEKLARAEDKPGFMFKLDFPTWHAVMLYADDRDLRFQFYQAWVSRASGNGVHAARFDNRANMEEILDLRTRQAQMLGFDSYAAYSLATKMADSPDDVVKFLEDLLGRAKAQAQQELESLRVCAKEQGVDTLEPWDVGYYSEKLKQQEYGMDSEALRPWFPLPKVLDGLFQIVATLFDVQIAPASAPVWHDDVQFFTISRHGEVIAGFYLDPFARDQKQGGAWMNGARSRQRDASGALVLPLAYLVCNFTPPTDSDTPALLSHDEVVTLFHEFGHGLHHMLTDIDVSDVAGIHGVEWDAVELPSQMMEYFCFEPTCMPLLSEHYQDKTPLPQEMLDSLVAAKNFQSALGLLRQLEFSLFDMAIHDGTVSDFDSIHGTLEAVRQHTALLPPPDWNFFETSFSHIFAGGYAAGYYSYKWAEVMSADVYDRFQSNGVLDRKTGKQFWQQWLSQGGSKPAMDLFVDFMGRKPAIDAMLRLDGIVGE
jgi:oligopeptidase A